MFLLLLLLALGLNLWFLWRCIKVQLYRVSPQGISFWSKFGPKKIAWGEILQVHVQPDSYSLEFVTSRGTYCFSWHQRRNFSRDLQHYFQHIPAQRFHYSPLTKPIPAPLKHKALYSWLHLINDLVHIVASLILLIKRQQIAANISAFSGVHSDARAILLLALVIVALSYLNTRLRLNRFTSDQEQIFRQISMIEQRFDRSKKHESLERLGWNALNAVRSWPHGDVSTDSYIELASNQIRFTLHLDRRASSSSIRQDLLAAMQRYQIEPSRWGAEATPIPAESHRHTKAFLVETK
jgi:hypothetical protein